MNISFNESIFLKSALSFNNPFITTMGIMNWVKDQNDRVSVKINKISFSDLKSWHFDNDISKLQHESGKFFSIDGLRVNTNYGNVKTWDQPIINQPEIGYLGFITKEFNGVLHFLLQAKIEPGNINYVQLSPTLQATKSNYTQVHKGKSPAYLDYFVNAKPNQILLDQLQSEQGARFLRKRNRNIIIKIEEDIFYGDNVKVGEGGLQDWLFFGKDEIIKKYINLFDYDDIVDEEAHRIHSRHLIKHNIKQKSISDTPIEYALLKDLSGEGYSDFLKSYNSNGVKYFDLDKDSDLAKLFKKNII